MTISHFLQLSHSSQEYKCFEFFCNLQVKVQQTLLQSCSNLFPFFSFHYSLIELPFKYGVFSDPYFPAFGPEKLRIWILFRKCLFSGFLMCITMKLRNVAF